MPRYVTGTFGSFSRRSSRSGGPGGWGAFGGFGGLGGLGGACAKLATGNNALAAKSRMYFFVFIFVRVRKLLTVNRHISDLFSWIRNAQRRAGLRILPLQRLAHAGADTSQRFARAGGKHQPLVLRAVNNLSRSGRHKLRRNCRSCGRRFAAGGAVALRRRSPSSFAFRSLLEMHPGEDQQERSGGQTRA